MRTIEELKMMIEKLIQERGFCKDNTMFESVFCLEEKPLKKVTRIGTEETGKLYTALFLTGRMISVEYSRRSNGSLDNNSITVCLTEWNGTKGELIKRIKIYNRYDDMKIRKLTNDIVDEY